MATRVGVDTGGAFTDLIFYDDQTGEVRVTKQPTTPTALEDGVVAAVAAAVPSQMLKASEYFLHGTTIGLNSLLERQGAKVGLLATRGFRDILEIRRGDRDDPYDIFCKQPPPLVPRRLRIAVTERMRADGVVHIPLEEDDVRRAMLVFEAEGVDCIAIAFLHSYANPGHELAAEHILREAGFKGELSLSHRVSGEYREYERTCTTVIDAYVRPRMAIYLRRLQERLASAGFDGQLLLTRSAGGAMTLAQARSRPFETILSGPVAGAEGAAELARNLDLGDVITADVGGTSFDTSLIINGRPHAMYQGSVVGLPLQTPWVDVRSIGAGGGSIAWVDVGGLLRVGPQSAGAYPGPASYRHGGTKATVTDAAFVLGMLGEGRLASGIVLDVESARAALRPLGEQLHFEVDGVARGILTIANANMANAIREITVEKGQDPRHAVLMAFGGAGPLFGTLLARELDIRQVLIPRFAGNFSAWGLLGADLIQTAARTRIMKLANGTIERANGVLAELFTSIASRLTTQSDGAQAGFPEIALDMRYVGQEHTITVPVKSSDSGTIAETIDEIHRAFTREYSRTFGHTMDEEVEIVSLRVTLRTHLPRRREEHMRRAVDNGGATRNISIEAYSFTQSTRLPFQLVGRLALDTEAVVRGPAIILEETATTYLDAEFEAKVHSSGALFITDLGRS